MTLIPSISPVRNLLLVKPITVEQDVGKTAKGLYVKSAGMSENVFQAKVLRVHPMSCFAEGDTVMVRKNPKQVQIEDGCFIKKRDILAVVGGEFDWANRMKQARKIR